MMLSIAYPVLVGPIRIFLLIISLLIMHQIITKQPISNYSLDYILKRLVLYASMVFVVIFVLVQLNMYDSFTLMLLFFVLLFLQYLSLGSIYTIKQKLKEKRRSFLLSFFEVLEQGPKNIIKERFAFLKIKKANYFLITAFTSALAVFVSRYIFLKNDLYTLSGLWMQNLQTVKDISLNKWFLNNLTIKGELVYINFYSKIAGISEEMALHSFGLLENFILGIILYWLINKVTKSNYIAPIVGVLFFAFFYNFLPININIALEHNPVYFALCFALPAMLFTVKPEVLVVSRLKYILIMAVIYITIGFINLFVAIYIIPIFLLIALLFNTSKGRANSYFYFKHL